MTLCLQDRGLWLWRPNFDREQLSWITIKLFFLFLRIVTEGFVVGQHFCVFVRGVGGGGWWGGGNTKLWVEERVGHSTILWRILMYTPIANCSRGNKVIFRIEWDSQNMIVCYRGLIFCPYPKNIHVLEMA